MKYTTATRLMSAGQQALQGVRALDVIREKIPREREQQDRARPRNMPLDRE
jgi:hypothetical protein